MSTVLSPINFWTFAIGECPVGESLIGEIRESWTSVSVATAILISTHSKVTVLSGGLASVMSVVSKPTLHIPMYSPFHYSFAKTEIINTCESAIRAFPKKSTWHRPVFLLVSTKSLLISPLIFGENLLINSCFFTKNSWFLKFGFGNPGFQPLSFIWDYCIQNQSFSGAWFSTTLVALWRTISER